LKAFAFYKTIEKLSKFSKISDNPASEKTIKNPQNPQNLQIELSIKALCLSVCDPSKDIFIINLRNLYFE